MRTRKFDPLTEVVVEGTIWMDINDNGQIFQLYFIGCMLTPGVAMGMAMIKGQA